MPFNQFFDQFISQTIFSADPFFRFVVWFGFFLFLLVFMTLLVTIGFRIFLDIRTHRRIKLKERWQPLLVEAVLEEPQGLPRLGRFDVYYFLRMWNTMQMAIRGEETVGLNHVIYRLRLFGKLLLYLHSIRLSRRLMALMTFKNMQDMKAWDVLEKQISQRNPMVSLAVIASLVTIDPQRSMPLLMDKILQHGDWPLPMVANVLREAGAENVSGPLVKTLAQAPDSLKPRIIHLIGSFHHEGPIPEIVSLLQKSNSPQVILACLRVIEDPQCLDTVRQYLTHDFWPVRVQAVLTIGRLGGADEAQSLIPLLQDRQWWVRYRTAQALSQLPGMDVDKLKEIRARQTDRFAQDVLTQVMAEVLL